MNLILKTKVAGNYYKVMDAFDRQLFEALKPPFGEMNIVEFTGSKKGDTVHLKFESPFKAEWISKITEDGEDQSKAWFVDEGTVLPWPLHTWKHKHIVQRLDDKTSIIIDDISFTAKNSLLTLFMYPALFIGFFPRKKVYRAYFDKLNL